jgi:hypothetical protein
LYSYNFFSIKISLLFRQTNNNDLNLVQKTMANFSKIFFKQKFWTDYILILKSFNHIWAHVCVNGEGFSKSHPKILLNPTHLKTLQIET